MMIEDLNTAVGAFGLMTRGAFQPVDRDDILVDVGTVVLIGNAGPDMWRQFSTHMPDGPNPLDTWTRQTLDPVAAKFGGRAVYPFDGPPYFPFQRWAMQADDVSPSPIGPLVHPLYGMWHAYRAAILFEDRLETPDTERTPSPCLTCAEKPCINTCPVSAFAPDHYEVAACRAHIAVEAGADCLQNACMARRACPIGQDYIYEPAQAEFHMQKFLRADGA